MMLVVRLSRATSTSIEAFLRLPIVRLHDWACIIIEVIKSEK
jgi:hypothetical protein